MVTQAQKAVDEIQAILNKPGDWTDEEINRLRALYSQHLGPSEMIIRDVAKLRSSLEMILAVRRFDKSSADLVKTTNKLTSKILLLTYIAIGIGLLQIVEAAISLFSNK